MESTNKASITQVAKQSTPTEDLPLAERLKLAEAANSFSGIVPGSYIDAKDTVENWCVANVLKVDGGDVTVNYDGWSSNYDMTFKIAKSSKICGFRLASRGYTGQVRIPLRKLEFSLSQLADNRKQLEEVLASDFGALTTPHEVTQYLRGRLYLYVDFLLANEYKEPEKEIGPVTDFFRLATKLVAKWLGHFPDLLRPFAEGMNNPKLILVDRNVALASCGYELMDMLKWLFCQCPRTLFFFARYDVNVDAEKAKFTKELNKEFEQLREKSPLYGALKDKITLDSELVYGLFANLFNEFCSAGGIQALERIMSAAKSSGCRLTLETIAVFLAPFRSIKDIAKDELCKQIATAGKEAFLTRVKSLDDKDIKDMGKEQVAASMTLMRGFLRLIHTEEETASIVQDNELAISLKFLKSPALEKRLNGLAEIKRMIDRADPPLEAGLSADYLVKWIVEHGILEMILNDSAHPELVRRTAHILTFLARHGAVTVEIIELLWRCQLDKHEDIVRAVFDTIKDIVEYLSIEAINRVNSKLATYSPESYDEKLIGFTKDFTLKACQARARADDMKKSVPANGGPSEPAEVSGAIERNASGEVVVPADECLYGLPRLWALQQDDSPLSQQLVEQVLSAFKEIMTAPTAARYRHQYLYLCMENLKNNRSVPQSLTLANYILLLIYRYKLVHKTTMQELIKRLAKDYGVVEIMVNSFQHYARLVRDFISKGAKPETLADAVIVGKYKHSFNLDMRFIFTECILKFGGGEEVKLGKDNLLKLWKLFVEDSPAEFDTRHFLRWLSSEKETNANVAPSTFLSVEENRALFDTLCESRLRLGNAALALGYQKCFANTFKLVNIAAGAGEVKRGRIRTLKFASVVGMDAVWTNARLCSDEPARVKFCELLIDVYTNLHDSLSGQRKEIMADFVDRCMEWIAKAKDLHDDLTLSNLLKLLQQFFDTMDGTKYDTPEDADVHKFQITLIARPGPESKPTEVGLDVTLGCIRRKAAELFHIPFSWVQLLTAMKTFEPDDDDTQLRSAGWAHTIYVQKLPGAAGAEDPKSYLAQNQGYIDRLFALLAREGSPYVDQVWGLLTTLPANKKMQADIETLSIPTGDTEEWNSLLDSRSIHRLLYSLQIVEGILISLQDGKKDPAAKKPDWLEQFCQKAGLAHIFSAFINLPTASINNPLTRKCFALLLKVLFIIQTAGYSLKKHVHDYEAQREKLVERVLFVLDAFVQHSIAAEAEKALQPLKRAKSTADKEDKQSSEKQQAASMSDVMLKEKKIMLEEAGAFVHGFALIKGDIGESYNYFEQLMKFANFRSFILSTLVITGNTVLQQAFANELTAIYRMFKGRALSATHAHVVLIPYMMQDMVKVTLEQETKCRRFYSLLCGMVKEMTLSELSSLPMDFHGQIAVLADCIHTRQVRENKSTDTDEVIIGLLNLVEALVKKFHGEKQYVGPDLIEELLHHCLFEFPKSGSRSRVLAPLPPKCKSQESRQAAFNLLCTLACDTPSNLRQIIEFLAPIHTNAAWRTKRTTDWNIMPEISEKSTTGYVGIKNLSCTCYMNALLQQMYMIPSFRNDILAVDDPNKTLSPDENPLFQTQCLFTALSESVKQYYNPKAFCHAFKDWEGRSINVLEQMDVDEFFSLFLDKLETAIKGTPQANTIKRHFGGVFANQLLCKDCPHSSVRDEPFLALNLQVKNKRSLEQCLESFVEGEMLQGSNAYHCEKCDKKVTTLKRVCIRRLPRYLVCVLKRFDINYDTMQKFKINGYCEFPTRLNMEPYTQEGLAKKDREREREKARKEGRDLDEPQSAQSGANKYPPEYYDYKLTGVVIHLGVADAGHYYSLIMDREKDWLPEKERWYEFNDTLVEHYDPEEIRNDAFGGEERMSSMGGLEGAMRAMGKIRNAYLLVYERASQYEPPAEEGEEERIRPSKVPATVETIHQAIMAENIKYWYNKYMFHEDYLVFALKLCLTWNSSENVLAKYPSKNNDYSILGIKEEEALRHSFQTERADLTIPADERQPMTLVSEEGLRDLELLVFKYAAMVLLTTLLRAGNRALVPDFVDTCKAYLNSRSEAAQWLIWQFTNSRVIYEFLLECHEEEVRGFVVGLIYCAMIKCYEKEKTEIANPDKKCGLKNFANCMMQQLAGCRKYTIYFEQFLETFARMALLGGEMREYLLRSGALRRLLGFWTSVPETQWDSFVDIPFTENAAPELGLSSVVDEKFLSFFEECIAMRREKTYQNADPTYTFLFQAVSLLLRSTTATTQTGTAGSPFALPPHLKAVGIDPALLYALANTKIVVTLIHECRKCRSDLATKATAQALVHVSWANLDLKMAITKAVTCGIVDSEWDELRRMFFFLKSLLWAEDMVQKAYVEAAMSSLVETMVASNKAYYATYTSVKYLVSLARDNKLVLEWMQKNTEKCAWIHDWLKTNQYPSYRSEVLPFKSKEQNEEHSRKGSAEPSAEEQRSWATTMKLYADNLVKVQSGNVTGINDDIGDCDSLYYQKFFKGQVVETWERFIVKRVLDEMLYLQPEGLSEKFAEWVSVDSSNIAKDGTHTVSVKDDMRDSLSDEDSPLGYV